MIECEGCRYNRKMRTWGETFFACHYKLDTGKDIYDLKSECSGYEVSEKQIEMDLT